MKKFVLASALAFGTFTTFAVTPIIIHDGIMDEIITVEQSEFKEISPDQLPTAVTDALQRDFPSAKVEKAYINENNEYKLEVSVNGATQTLYADEEGNWLEM